MCEQNVWVSPDNRIKKDIVVNGKWGPKPWENSECKINITNCSVDVTNYNNSNIVIGENDSSFGRLLDVCLQTMLESEVADVTFNLLEGPVSFKLQLIEFKTAGCIWEWDAEKKYNIALKHKNKGVELFKTQYIDASHRFSKALKIITSIPIDVQKQPVEIDGIKVVDITSLKAILYNNLASCHLKNNNFKNVIELCMKVLNSEDANVKALYKIAVAYMAERDYERALSYLKKLLEIEPDNKPAAEKLKIVNFKLAEANQKVNSIIKKMFSDL